MQVRQKQVIEAYQRVQDFLAGNPVPPPGSYGEPKAMLDDVVAQLSEHRTDQAAGARLTRADLASEMTLARELREQHLRPISLIARAKLRGSPGIDRALTMPDVNSPTTKLIGEAEAFAKVGELYKETFVQSGRPSDFLEQLIEASARLNKVFLGKARNLGTRVGAKAALQAEILRGRSAIQMLDAIVTTAFVGNVGVLAKWRSARRVRGLPSGTTKSKTGVAATTSPAVTTPAASPEQAA